MSEDEEFEKVKLGIEAATDVLTHAIARHAKGEWDYLIVAVPHGGETTRIGMMASVPADMIPGFLAWLHVQFKSCEAKGTILSDERPAGDPS